MPKQKAEYRHMNRPETSAVLGRMLLDLNVSAVIGQVVLSTLLAIVTAGIGVIFFPYIAAKLILSSIVICDEIGHPTARLRCTLGWAEQAGHAVFWALLVGLTGGIMAPFYVFALAHFVIKRTELYST